MYQKQDKLSVTSSAYSLDNTASIIFISSIFSVGLIFKSQKTHPRVHQKPFLSATCIRIYMHSFLKLFTLWRKQEGEKNNNKGEGVEGKCTRGKAGIVKRRTPTSSSLCFPSSLGNLKFSCCPFYSRYEKRESEKSKKNLPNCDSFWWPYSGGGQWSPPSPPLQQSQKRKKKEKHSLVFFRVAPPLQSPTIPSTLFFFFAFIRCLLWWKRCFPWRSPTASQSNTHIYIDI